jgi:glycine cleavage system aminomethyltransferase T
MSFEFLSVDGARSELGFEPVARSSVERALRAAGARLEVRDGWAVAVDYGSVEDEVRACRETAGIAESSALGKLEIQGPAPLLAELAPPDLEPRRASRAGDTWWCPVHPERILVLCPLAATAELREELARASLVELTTAIAAFTVVGPAAREILARLSALDTRQQSFGEQGFAPVSVGRVPAMVLRENGDRFLVLFGSAYADYMWTALTDAGFALGASLVGTAALESIAEAVGA